MKTEGLEDFIRFLELSAEDSDSWWLKSWVNDRVDEYNELPFCDCGSRLLTMRSDIYSKTGNHVLETWDICRSCNRVVAVRDNRPELRARLERGDVKIKDAEILRKELEKLA